jgi:predicted ATPase/class 3 adenylate cyclase/DNA-binding CsgD family transcriptional regulator
MSALPSGTLTFLFTDVEASTRTWLSSPQAMSAALARHDALIEDLVARHGGHVVRPRGEGDSRFAVFIRPSDAISAACAIQLALTREEWALADPLCVRMAVHTGEGELRAGDYYGPAVNHCARLRAAAHGGQVLVSTVTADLVREALASDVGLQDLGEHRLKDLERPEHIWQVVHPGLRADFPPLPLVSPSNHNLPYQLNAFVGREQATEELRDLLVSTRLLTLTGPGGIGKTRLALAVAEIVLPDYADGVWLVELASLSDPALVPATVAATLGVRESTRPLIDQLSEVLCSRAMLLVLDNCEHIIGACAELCQRLLQAGQDLQILTTSREPLGVTGETIWRVPGLAFPAVAGADASHKQPVTEAMQLFTERAVAVAPSFRISDHTAAVADVCRRLDGIPLAIELAAARITALTPEQIAERLSDRFRLLVSGSRTTPRRQQTLRATMDWSYDLLTKPERTLLNRLSVFAGGCTLEAAEVVCADAEQHSQIDGQDVLDLVTGLVNRSLVVAEPIGSTTRYRMVETLRQYAAERLHETGEETKVRNRHIDWCIAFAESAQPALVGPEQAVWLARLEHEHDNFRAALSWDLGNPRDAEPMLRLAGALYPLWWHHDHLTEGRAWLAHALDRDADPTKSSVSGRRAQVRVLTGAGVLARSQSDYRAADTMLTAAVSLARELDDTAAVADGLFWLGSNAYFLADAQRAQMLSDESLTLWRELRNPLGMSHALGTLAHLAWQRGDDQQTRELLHERMGYARESGDVRAIAAVSANLGILAYQHGETDNARELLTSSYRGFQELDAPTMIAWVLRQLARLSRDQGDVPKAEQLYGESMTLSQRVGATWGMVECIEGVAGLALATGKPERAVRLFSCATAVREDIGLLPSSRVAAEFEAAFARLRSTLGASRFEAEWQAGRTLSLNDAISLVLPRTATGTLASTTSANSQPLTRRESEIAALIARGRTNREIAKQLVIAISTAERHVANILAKLDLNSRTQIVAWVLERSRPNNGAPLSADRSVE